MQKCLLQRVRQKRGTKSQLDAIEMKRGISKSSGAISPYFKRLSREFYDRPAIELSKGLLGKVLARKLPDGTVLRGTIVETEAYPGELDPASHSYGGKKTPRNGAMFMDPGTAYVYFTYGMYYCFNVSSQELGGASLIRAVEPLEDYQSMRDFRSRPVKKKKVDGDQSKVTKKSLKTYELANGPGKLCIAFDIDRNRSDKLDLCTSDMMWLEENEDGSFQPGNFKIEESKRVGIDSTPPEARNQLWRFLIVDNLAVSTAKPYQILRRLQVEGAGAL